jgi:hypothetical protein
MHRNLLIISGAIAAVVAVMYGTAVAAATMDGPHGMEVSSRFGAIALSAIVLSGLLSLQGWMIRAESRSSAKLIAAVVADVVAGAVAARIQQSLTRVADESVDKSSDAIIEAMRDIAEGLSGEMQTMVLRARTQGMVEEATQRAAGNVASLAGRRDI